MANRKLLVYNGDNIIDTIEFVVNKQPYSTLIARLGYGTYGLELMDKTSSMAPMLRKIVAYLENPDYDSTLQGAGRQILQAVFETRGCYFREVWD